MGDTAAAQVFAIPELLEIILYHTAQSRQVFESRHVALFPLQRVCRSFNAAINKSIALRRMSFLLPIDDSDEPPMSGMDPAVWFFRDYLSLMVLPSWHEVNRAFIIRLQTMTLHGAQEPYGRFTFPEMTVRRRADARASWRYMRLSTARDDVPLYVGFNVYYTIADIEDHNANRFYGITWRLMASTTLGELFDKYCTVLDRTMEEHLKAANRFWTLRLEDRNSSTCATD